MELDYNDEDRISVTSLVEYVQVCYSKKAGRLEEMG